MQPDDPDEAAQLGRLLHDLSEALTATGNYLRACHLLESHSEPASSAKLCEAIGMAIEQNKRAAEIVVRLRAGVKR
jgi:hypothetical protein